MAPFYNVSQQATSVNEHARYQSPEISSTKWYAAIVYVTNSTFSCFFKLKCLLWKRSVIKSFRCWWTESALFYSEPLDTSIMFHVDHVLFWNIHILSHLRQNSASCVLRSVSCSDKYDHHFVGFPMLCSRHLRTWKLPTSYKKKSNVTKQLMHSWGGGWMNVRTVFVLGFDMFPSVTVP